jgi:hypothetical protein
MKETPLLFQSQVLSNDDPLMLGRVRARRLIDNYDDIIKSFRNPSWDEKRDAWSKRDPFILLPLLPYYLYQIPKVDEMVLMLYANPGTKFLNQYYIQSTFYSPTATGFQYYKGSDSNMGTGIQYLTAIPLKIPYNQSSLTSQENVSPNSLYTEGGVHRGVFPEPGDNSLLGRGSADVIVKENDVLIRAGKYKNDELQPNVVPGANTKRSFIQLSRFTQSVRPLPPQTVINTTPIVLLTKYLIEYSITNPENQFDLFSGNIFLYQLRPDISTNTQNLTLTSKVSAKLKTLVVSERFTNMSKSNAIITINNFIRQCNRGGTVNGKNIFLSPTEKFPIYYRPTNENYDIINGKTNDPAAQKNLSDIFKGIKLNNALTGGYGLIYEKDKVGSPKNIKKSIVKRDEYIPNSNTVFIGGADTTVLLSHNSSIPGKGKINMSDTLYGINEEKFRKEILAKTSSMVRGEELLELINLIVNFLLTHTHSFPGRDPVEETESGIKREDIETEFRNATNKILNQNIRLN